MSRWSFVPQGAGEIAHTMERVLWLRARVKDLEEGVKAAKAGYHFESRHFADLEALADYAQEMIARRKKVRQAQEALEDGKDELEGYLEALRSVIPPGGSVMYERDDGTTYKVIHRDSSRGDSYIQFYTQKGKDA